MAESLTSLRDQVVKFKDGIREVAHEMNNCLGVVRTAMYLLETNRDEAKRQHYLSMVNAGIDRLEASLKRLRALREEVPSSVTPPTPEQQ